MNLPANKTKIVCTIGPATESQEAMEKLLRAGMNVARLNFSHGDFAQHERVIRRLRAAAESVGKHLAIMADLPGPKMRIGMLAQEAIELEAGAAFTLTTRDITGTEREVSVSFSALPRVVKTGDALFLNDGLIQLRVKSVHGEEVECEVVAGGELRSRKGLNLPGIDLGMSAFTDRDRECLAFALEHGVDAVSQSFVNSAADVVAVREAAREMGYDPFVLAKIERSGALRNIDEILEACDGVMIARGDLGVEIPIERIAVTQKQLMQKALKFGKPIITATQMLESMTHSRQPTRAEATDVANAILDGTDAVMLSGESAMGRYPAVATATLARIAAATEPHLDLNEVTREIQLHRQGAKCDPLDLIALSVEYILEHPGISVVMVPTLSGNTARRITRFRLPVWVVAVSHDEDTCRRLQFSFGVDPVYHTDAEADWEGYSRRWVSEQGLPQDLVLLIQGPSPRHPDANSRLEIIDLSSRAAGLSSPGEGGPS